MFNRIRRFFDANQQDGWQTVWRKPGRTRAQIRTEIGARLALAHDLETRFPPFQEFPGPFRSPFLRFLDSPGFRQRSR